MKEIKINRFLRRKPENISFAGTPIPEPIESQQPVKRNDSDSEQENVRSDVRPSERQSLTDQFTVFIPQARKKIRHSFDIYEDQKIALDKLQLAIMFDLEGKKPSLGEIVQEAIDLYIKQRSKRIPGFKIIKSVNEHTDEGSNVRSDKQYDGGI